MCVSVRDFSPPPPPSSLPLDGIIEQSGDRARDRSRNLSLATAIIGRTRIIGDRNCRASNVRPLEPRRNFAVYLSHLIQARIYFRRSFERNIWENMIIDRTTSEAQ